MNTSVSKIISKLVLSDRIIKIKLLGDSITHGVGGTNYCENGETIVDGFARNNDGYCWANLIKEHMETQFNCVVTNNACSGTKIEFIIDNYAALVDNDDDIIICAIGTNNRNQAFSTGPRRTKNEHLKILYNNIIKLYNMFHENKKEVIFIANIPAASQSEKDGPDFWRVIHMNDVNDIYMKASLDGEFPFVSLYTSFLEYCDLTGTDVNSLLADGVHPNDEGHSVIYRLILKELGIGRSVI